MTVVKIMKKIKIVVPCYNEEGCITEFYKRVNSVMANERNYCYSFLFVDDGSQDNTLNEILRLLENDKSMVKYISFARNFGKEAAIYAGLSYARDADIVVLIDADLQHPPELIPEMLKEIEMEYDCCGARRITRDGEPVLRSALAKGFYKVINHVTSMNLVPGGSDYRVMTKDVVAAVVSLTETERFTKGILSWVGFQTKWIEYKNVDRFAGNTKWSLSGLMKYAISGYMAFATTPLRIAIYLGLIIVSISFFYGIYVFYHALLDSNNRSGYATIVLLLLFIGGVIILLLGVIGEYLARIYMEVKHRPLFIIKDSNMEKDCYL